MINKKNLWFLSLFSLVLVLSVYYITMPTELLLTNNGDILDNVNMNVEEVSIVESLRQQDNSSTLEEINKLKATISDSEVATEDKNKAFDSLKLLNQISSKEELLEEKIKNTWGLDSFIKINGDQIRVVVDSDEHTSALANNIMKTIQNNFDTNIECIKKKVRDNMDRTILTKREKEIFTLLIQNKTTKEIAEELNISEKTVRNHISNTMQKLGVKGRAQAVVELLRMKVITL